MRSETMILAIDTRGLSNFRLRIIAIYITLKYIPNQNDSEPQDRQLCLSCLVDVSQTS